jgi:hypothetical protein
MVQSSNTGSKICETFRNLKVLIGECPCKGSNGVFFLTTNHTSVEELGGLDVA